MTKFNHKVYFIILLLSILTLTNACANNNAKDDDDYQECLKLRQKFDQIKLADFTQIGKNHVGIYGKGGTTLKQAKKILGKPKSVEKEDKGKTYIWQAGKDYSMVVEVQIVHGRARYKLTQGFKYRRPKDKITLQKYKKLPRGLGYQKIINEFGKPDEVISGGFWSQWYHKNRQEIYYKTDIQGKHESNATITLSIVDNKLFKKEISY
ncbi:DUF3862 domain-containing protein [Lactobacillus sp. ESL0791]|uniref:DUF3862 domain-containing protein n=1 Tax=Lactobacillus sp. ESL0791 TaxID=2983234 RepID=UPI0023F89719|nr:DUF3862 domain-containing protein [Lactobacillus sp. ESL0791]MDF7638698.1 DUF3862 domain-containing protein [Lactobacillus sp. ESL0791]